MSTPCLSGLPSAIVLYCLAQPFLRDAEAVKLAKCCHWLLQTLRPYRVKGWCDVWKWNNLGADVCFRVGQLQRLRFWEPRFPIPTTLTHLCVGDHADTVPLSPHLRTFVLCFQNWRWGIGHYIAAVFMRLPPSVECLEILEDFNLSLQHLHLPTTITRLVLGDSFNQPLAHLPPALTELRLGVRFRESLKDVQWPSGLRRLELRRDHSYSLAGAVFPPSLQTLWFHCTLECEWCADPRRPLPVDLATLSLTAVMMMPDWGDVGYDLPCFGALIGLSLPASTSVVVCGESGQPKRVLLDYVMPRVVIEKAPIDHGWLLAPMAPWPTDVPEEATPRMLSSQVFNTRPQRTIYGHMTFYSKPLVSDSAAPPSSMWDLLDEPTMSQRNRCRKPSRKQQQRGGRGGRKQT